MRFETLSRENVEHVRQWRNANIEALRTPFPLTKEQQEKFYDNVICSRDSKHRFYGIWQDDVFIGMAGIENIEFENGLGEISIMIDPKHRGKNLGTEAISLLLKEGFDNLRLNNIYGECYACNPAIEFWRKIIRNYNMFDAHLPKRKYYQGKFWYSLYFCLDRETYYEVVR